MSDTLKGVLSTLATIAVFGLIGWGFHSYLTRDKVNPDIHYVSERCTVVEKGLYSSRMNNKFHTPYVAKFFLIRRINDTTMYTEINSSNWIPKDYKSGISDSLYYNTRIGDTLRFDYIAKNRFFKLTRQQIER